EHLRPCCSGDLRGLFGGRVRGLAGARRLLLTERRLVDEQIGALRELYEVERRRGVARDEHLAARSRRAEHLLRSDDLPVRERDRLAALQPPALRTRRHA